MTGYVLAGVTAILWAGQVVLVRLASQTGSPVDAFVIATGVAGAVGLVTVGVRGWPGNLLRIATVVAATSELAGLLGLLTLFLALERLEVAQASVIVALYPGLAAVAAWVWLGEPLLWRQALGLGLTVVGVVLVIR